MGNNLHEADAILAGILNEADSEAARIIQEAENYASQTIATANEQASNITKETMLKAEAQAKVIEADAVSKAAIEQRKNILTMQENLARDIVQHAEDAVRHLHNQTKYPDMLCSWIVEAAIALSSDSAFVYASKSDWKYIDDALLTKAEKDVFEISGKSVKLYKKNDEPVLGQGVYLVADGGRLAYDNRVKTRFERKRSEIRKLIYKKIAESI